MTRLELETLCKEWVRSNRLPRKMHGAFHPIVFYLTNFVESVLNTCGVELERPKKTG